MKILFVLSLMLGQLALAAEKGSAGLDPLATSLLVSAYKAPKPGTEEDTFKSILDTVLSGAVLQHKNMTIRGVTTPASECFAEEGTEIFVGIPLANTLRFEFGKDVSDPDYKTIFEAGQSGLILQVKATVLKGCDFAIDASFFVRDEKTGSYYWSGNEFLRIKNAETFKANYPLKNKYSPAFLDLSLSMGLTGQLLHFHMHSLSSVLQKTKKFGAEEYQFFGKCAADQELMNFDKAPDLALLSPEEAKKYESSVMYYEQLERCEIIFKDGQFKIPMKVRSK